MTDEGWPETSPVGSGTRFVIGYRPRALIGSVLLCLLLLGPTGYVYFLDALGPLRLVFFALWAVASLLIVPLSLRAAFRALRRAPLLTLDRDGVTLHSAWVRLPWSNVAEIKIAHKAGADKASDLLVFVPVDAGRAIEDLRGWPRLFARDGVRRVGGPIFLRVSQLTRPLDEVLAAARQWTAAPVRQHIALISPTARSGGPRGPAPPR